MPATQSLETVVQAQVGSKRSVRMTQGLKPVVQADSKRSVEMTQALKPAVQAAKRQMRIKQISGPARQLGLRSGDAAFLDRLQ
jgi:hypothetical protein